MNKHGRKCVFLDRDGIVNIPPENNERYILRASDFILQPGFIEVLRIIKNSGYEAVVITNQRGVALGVLTEEELVRIHEKLKLILKQHDLELLDIFYCPHDSNQCECRKPKPGMFLAAAAKHGIALSSSWMIGDQERDIEAGRRAGCRTILVNNESGRTSADFKVPDLAELSKLLKDILK